MYSLVICKKNVYLQYIVKLSFYNGIVMAGIFIIKQMSSNVSINVKKKNDNHSGSTCKPV